MSLCKLIFNTETVKKIKEANCYISQYDTKISCIPK